MDAFGTVPLDGTALLGQDPLMGSVWDSAAALDSNAGLTGVLSAMRSTTSRGAGMGTLLGIGSSELESLPTVATSDLADKTRTLVADSGTPAVDLLTGIAEGATLVGSEVNGEAILDLAVATAQEQLESFATDKEFLDKMNLAFGEDWRPQEAHALIQDLASGEEMPNIEALPAAELDANGAFGEDTVYISKEFLNKKNVANPEAVAGVLLEEIGHYVDQELSSVDSPGDEGDIFARLVQGETVGGAELAALEAENDSATIALNGEEITVELDASEPAPLEPVSIAAIDYETANTATPYPGYDLVYDPSAPEYNEDPAVVMLWQERMKYLGYGITPDGSYGDISKAVAIEFQQDKGLDADGIVGPLTWEATFSAAASEPAPLEPVSIAAIDYETANTATPYPGYDLVYDPSAPEYNEDPAVVMLWQERMKYLGYGITPDGSYGDISKAVAIEFQQDKGLDADGIVGPLTWEATFSAAASEPAPLEPVSIAAIDYETANTATPYPGYDLVYDPSAPEYNEDPAVVMLWQERMKYLGYGITPDGSYGDISKAVAIEFQQDKGLDADGIVGPLTWEATFSAAASEPAPLEPVSIAAIDHLTEAEQTEAYESLRAREFYMTLDISERIDGLTGVRIVESRPSLESTTWGMEDRHGRQGAEEMLKENKDFLLEAARYYEIDGRAIAGAIRWEYEENYHVVGPNDTRLYSRDFDEFAYDYVQETGSLDIDYSDYALDQATDVLSNPLPIPIEDFKIQGNGWGKIHYEVAKKILEDSGEEPPDNRTLATMLAVPPYAIDLIAREMQQAARAYSETTNGRINIGQDPAVLATLYQLGENGMSYETRAAELGSLGSPSYGEGNMGEWVHHNLESLKDYQTA